MELLKEGKVYEDGEQFFKRIEKTKKRLSFYRSLFRRIAVVSHYYTIQFLTAEEYLECGTPKYDINVENCTPYYSSTHEIMRPIKKRLEYINI